MPNASSTLWQKYRSWSLLCWSGEMQMTWRVDETVMEKGEKQESNQMCAWSTELWNIKLTFKYTLNIRLDLFQRVSWG